MVNLELKPHLSFCVFKVGKTEGYKVFDHSEEGEPVDVTEGYLLSHVTRKGEMAGYMIVEKEAESSETPSQV